MTSPPVNAGAPSAIEIRRAARSELPLLQAIDMAACSVFDAIGLHVNLSDTHPFVTAEAARWRAALAEEQVFVALSDGSAVGFAVVGRQDGAPYLDQLSVLPAFMRRGIGAALIHQVIALNGELPLWLTTYTHVPWNAPYYARFGFRVVPDVDCGAELRANLAQQRAALPLPKQRVAMVRAPTSGLTRG